jgi:AcrR family transcriptional regulator
MVTHVRQGVFFREAEPLPRGRHGLSREQIVDEQRERLMVAMTELLAAHGYSGVGIGEVAERAGVSRASFYECFADKQACAFAAYDRFIDVLLGRLAASVDPDDDWDGFMRTLLMTYFGILQDDLVVGRAFQVEMDAVGPQARERRRVALVRFAEFIAAQHDRLAAGDPTLQPLPARAYLAAVYAARQIVSDLLDQEPEPDLLALDGDLVGWVTESLRGP